MVIKLGKFELQNWAHSLCFGCGPNNVTVESWYRMSWELGKSAAVFLYATEDSNIWEMKCWYGLEFLGKLHDQRVTGTLKEVKDYVDNFLVKMSKYSAFF